MFGHALVNAFVSPADQNQPRKFIREAAGFGLIEDATLWREQDHAGAPLTRLIFRRPPGQYGFDGAKDRFGLQHHPLAAPERAVVNHMMFIECERTQIVDDDLDDSLLSRPIDNPEIERPRKKLRKDSQQVETHNQFSVFSFQFSVFSFQFSVAVRTQQTTEN